MRHYRFVTAVLIVTLFAGCGSTGEDVKTSDPQENNDESQNEEDEEGKKAVEDASNGAK